MAVNKIDYEVLESASKSYGLQAERLTEMLSVLNNVNSELQEGWQNKTARAFIEKYESEYKVALENIRDEIQSISEYIVGYVNQKILDDENSAGQI